jgi:peptidoglycan hydrolase-like protein with peptidoglycan-binding domain
MAKYYSTTLQKGSKGDEVKKWQQFLNSQGHDLAVDGVFGDKTYFATTGWQSENGLGSDGIVGKDTWGKAGYSLAPSSQDWSYGDFSYDDFKEPDKFTYDDYTESDAVKGAGNALNSHLANKPGEYQSQWQSQLDALMNSIMNREKFSYDVNEDALYQQYKDKYIQQGKLAMADTIGQASAMTGGYGNSYAQSVGQQAYQGQLDNLNDIVPELYAMALDQYNREGQELYNQYGLVMDRENFDYGRYRDKVSDFLTERDYLQGRYDSERGFDYGKYVDDRNFAYGQYADDRNFDYSKYAADRSLAYDEYATDRNLSYEEYRAAIADEQWQKQYDESVRQYNEQMAFNKQQYEDSKVTNQTPVKDPTKEPDEIEEDYSDWEALDWEGYFATIRNNESKSAAEEELNRMTKAGLIPKNMISYAAIGARGRLGH